MLTALLKKCFYEAYRAFDKLFAFRQGGLEALGFRLSGKPVKAKVPSLKPVFDILEDRLVPSTTVTAALYTNDPRHLNLVTIGEMSAETNLGTARISQPLDFDQSPGTS